MIINNDSLHALKELDDNSIDAVITDPPYGYSFMGKDWDKAVPSVEIWKECLRVLKPGGWCMVMSAPRSDVQNAMISRLMEAGFRLDFTPIYWTYASGFPKAGNVGKLVDKRLGVQGEVIGQGKAGAGMNKVKGFGQNTTKGGEATTEWDVRSVASGQAKALDGSYTGFQPKPAVEVIIVAMKPLSEKTYVDQALKNGKGITWLDDGRIPSLIADSERRTSKSGDSKFFGIPGDGGERHNPDGRFPANLLVSDGVLNEHSRYFDLDKWYERNERDDRTTHISNGGDNRSQSDAIHGKADGLETLPFLAVPKASKSEKNKGLDGFDDRIKKVYSGGITSADHPETANGGGERRSKNHHPTVKPLKLMSYLITLTTRPGDTVLDPFVGSGTTVVAAKQLDRIGIGIEREPEYAEIARARLAHIKPEPLPDEPTTQPPTTMGDVLEEEPKQMRLL